MNNVSAAQFGVASWITPAHLQMLQAHGLTLGKLAKDMAAFEIFDSYMDAMKQRLDGQTVSPNPSRPPLTIYMNGPRKGKNSLELLVQDALAAADFLAIA